jgi:hypothetical protein
MSLVGGSVARAMRGVTSLQASMLACLAAAALLVAACGVATLAGLSLAR